MEKVLVAKGVADKLVAAETSIDDALVGVGNLLHGMISAKTELNLSATVGDPALAKVAEAITALSSARSALVAAHGQLDQSRLRLGIRTKMVPQNKDEPGTITVGPRAIEEAA